MNRSHWTSKIGFILAATGSAVGLGNVWKFPYLAGENGGGAFVLVYLAIVLVIGIPLLMAEFAIGRASGKNVWAALKDLAPKRSLFRWVGGLAILASFSILSYYTVVAGWVAGYIVEAVRFSFGSFQTPQAAAEHFGRLAADPFWAFPFYLLFMALTAWIVARGIQKGIESWCKFLMPLLGLILLVLVVWGLTLSGAVKGLVYLFRPDFSHFTWHSALMALGQAFFSLSLGMGIMITYGSYLHKGENIVTTSVWIACFDTLVALWAGIAIFAPVFTMGLDPAQGVGLTFHVLPAVFREMPGGHLFAILFFTLLAIAALTSTISILEVPVAFLIEQKSWSRPRAAWVTAGAATAVGIPCALSFGPMSHMDWFLGRNFFDFLDFLSANIFLPLVALFTTLFIGYVWGLGPAQDEIRKGSVGARHALPLHLWGFLIKFVCPISIAVILMILI